jgi:hypothetical protein
VRTVIRRRISGYSGGLHSWLRANVPDVNYKTAMRMNVTAEAVAAVIGATAPELMRCLAPDPRALADEPDAEGWCRCGGAGRDRSRAQRTQPDPVVERRSAGPVSGDGPGAEDTEGREAALDAARRFARAAADALKMPGPPKAEPVARDVAKTLREVLG